MKIKEVLSSLNEDQMDYQLKMSCMSREYTLKYPYDVEYGHVHQEFEGGSVSFEIDWSNRIKCKVSELLDYDDSLELISWDTDDGNMIELKSYFVHDGSKSVILI